MKTQQKCQKLLSQKIDIFFSNLNGLINYGKTIQKNKYLSNQELYPYADQSTNVQVQIQKLKAFIKENQQYFQSVNFDLKRIYIFLTGKTFLKGLLVSLLMELLIPIGIYMLDELTNYLKDEKYGNKLLFMLYPFGIVISFTLRNILYGQNEWIQCVWQSQNKTILQYLVFRKSLRIKNYAKKNKNSIDLQQDSESDDSSDDEGDNQNTEKNTILNEDIEQLGQLYWGVIQTTGSILIICTTLFQIYLKIGYSFVKGISILIFAFVVNILLGQLFERCFDQMRESKESRISLTKDVIDGIKSIKLFGWEGIFSKKIQKNRSREYKHLFFLRLIEAFLMLFFQSLSQILLYYFIASYIDDGNSFQNSNVFTIIALFGYLSYPLGILPESFRELIKFKVSFKRIQSFLNLSEIENNYQMNDDDNQPSNNQVKAKHFSIKGHTENKKRNSSCNGNVSIVIKRMQFRFFIKESDLKNEETKDNHQKFNSSNQSLSEDTDSSSSLNSKDKQKDVFQLNVNDLEIKKGSLNFVIGKIGSGKTAFLNAILNEIEAQSANQESNKTCHNEKKKINQSSMVINGSIGFVSQNHWLQNDSIKENILFGKENNQEFYEFCVKLCLLNQDFNQFSQGDQKIIYQNGSNLSGGQRQRIALCRAIYQDVDIYLFDDIFSSLDMQVSNQIFKNCIQDYLVKQKNKTVILVTSHYQFLKTNIENSKILIQNGSLTTNQKVISYFLKKCQEMNFQKIHSNQITPRKFSNENIDEANNFEKKESKEKNEEQKSNEDENEEERETGNIKPKTLKIYLMSMSLLAFIFQIVFYIVAQGVNMVIDLWLSDQQELENSNFYFLNTFFGNFQQTFMYLTILQFVVTLISCCLFIYTSLASSKHLYNQLNDTVIYSKMTFFDKNNIGRIISRFSEDIGSVDEEIPQLFQQTFEQFFNVISYPLGITIQFPWMWIFFLIGCFYVKRISSSYRQISREVKRLDSVNQDLLINYMAESCKGTSIIRAFRKEEYIISQFLKKLKNCINTFTLQLALEQWMYIRLYLFSNTIQLVIAIISALIIWFRLPVNGNIIIFTFTYSILFSQCICEVVNYICQMESELISVERISQFFDNDVENVDKIYSEIEQLKQEDNNFLNNNEISENFHIIFKNVSLCYEDITQSGYALNNFSLKIKKGEKIAICGRTGSGKTSILNALFRLYQFQKGKIFINNKDIENMSLKELRLSMSVIPQFGFIYNSTLRNNIDPLQEIEDQEIYNLLQSLSDEFQQDDINYQKVALRDSEIIFLDEATSNMDPLADRIVHDRLFGLGKDNTLIVITHRLENIDRFDKIIVMDQGAIVEQGTKQELQQIQNGYFNNLLNQK